ncbi:diguanylate cyclase [Streptomyces sp. SID4985]|uniref:diguanylate cyclase n=1 Tax=Streptomyces sp. SID4985 TaxID=2690292 RepID=UPI001371D1C5|nr:diguanylate cyclase [Streptomyces sp. SID4985]MYQ48609.1 diguanylate cyclase [Streptomyces sp. SID4985]
MALRLLPRTTRFAYRVARHVPRWAWPPQARFAYRVVRIAPHVVPHVPGTTRRHRRHGGTDLHLAGPYATDATRPTEPEYADRRSPLLGILPLWAVPAVADWWLRRRAHVERTTGTQESAAHALMVAEAGVPLVLGLLARVNPLVLTVMTGAAVTQGATAVYDASLATGARETRPVEQCFHNLLNVLPLTTLALTASLHPDQVRATLHGGPGPHDWRLLPKEPPLPTPCLVALGAVVTAGVVLPYAEELWRCRRAARAREE